MTHELVENATDQVHRLRRRLYPGDRRGAGGGQLPGQPLRQILRFHCQQAVQPLRPDHQGGEGPEERRQASTTSTTPRASRRRATCWTATRLSPKLHVDYIDPVKKPQQAQSRRLPARRPRSWSIAARKGRGQEPHRRRSHRRADPLAEDRRAQCLLRDGQRRAQHRRQRAQRLLGREGRAGAEQLQDPHHSNLLSAGAQPAAGKRAAVGQPPPAAGKLEVPKDCTVLIVAGPQHDYTQPEVDAIKAYVEGGGQRAVHARPGAQRGPRRHRREQPLDALLASWGVTPNKDLVLDTSGIGQIFGLGPEVPLVASYDSHPIVDQMKDVATAFPLSRSLDVKNGDKTSVEKLFEHHRQQLRHHQPELGQHPHRPQEGQEGPAHPGRRRHLQRHDPGPVRGGGQLHVGGNSFIRFNGNRDLFLNMINWLTSDEDLISIRPKEPEDRPLNMSAQKLSMVFWLSVVIFPLGWSASAWPPGGRGGKPMKPKGLLIAVVLLAVLGGVVWWSNKKQAAAGKSHADTDHQDAHDSGRPVPGDPHQEADRRGDRSPEARTASGRSTEPKQLPADQDAVVRWCPTLASLNADKMVEEKAADLKPYGLNDPDARYHGDEEGRQDRRLLIGDDTPTGSGAYAKLAGRAAQVVHHRQLRQDQPRQDARRPARQAPAHLRFRQAHARGACRPRGRPSSSARTPERVADREAAAAARRQLRRWIRPGRQAEGRQDGPRRAPTTPPRSSRQRREGGDRHRDRRQRQPDASKSARTRTRTTTPRAPRWRASTRVGLRPRRCAGQGPGRLPQQEAVRFRLQRSRPRSSSRAPRTPRAATSGCPARRPWTTPACRA